LIYAKCSRPQAPGTAEVGGGGGTASSMAFATGWTMPSSTEPTWQPWMRSVLSGLAVNRILVPTQGNGAVGESMSLYRAGLRLALFLPLGVAMPPSH
jgi:hypothetical protein